MSLPTITIQGPNFMADGKPWRYIGVSEFALFKRWLQEPDKRYLIDPRLREWRAYAQTGGYTGPIVLRVFRYAQPSNRFGVPPWSYAFDELRTFTAYVAELGFYVDWTAGDSRALAMPEDGPTGQQQHLNLTCQALASIFCFLETQNEPMYGPNGVDVTKIQPAHWGSYLCDSGMYSEHDDWVAHPQWNLDFVSYHGRRDDQGQYWPRWLTDMPEAAASMLTMFGKPAVHKEPQRCNRTGQPRDPEFWFRMGQVAAYSGVLFHSEDGRDGDHLTPHEQACAEAFFAGVQGASGR